MQQHGYADAGQTGPLQGREVGREEEESEKRGG